MQLGELGDRALQVGRGHAELEARAAVRSTGGGDVGVRDDPLLGVDHIEHLLGDVVDPARSRRQRQLRRLDDLALARRRRRRRWRWDGRGPLVRLRSRRVARRGRAGRGAGRRRARGARLAGAARSARAGQAGRAVAGDHDDDQRDRGQRRRRCGQPPPCRQPPPRRPPPPAPGRRALLRETLHPFVDDAGHRDRRRRPLGAEDQRQLRQLRVLGIHRLAGERGVDRRQRGRDLGLQRLSSSHRRPP